MDPESTNNFQNNEDRFLRQLVFKYLTYWPLFVVLLLISTLCAYLYLRYKVPVFESSAEILIKDEQKGLDDTNILEDLNIFGSKKIVENEMEIIQSRTLIGEVVKDLHLYAPVYEYGKIVNITAYTKSPVIIILENPDSIKEGKKLEKIFFSYLSNNSVKINNKVYPLNQWNFTRWGKIMFVPNRYYVANNDEKPLYFTLVKVREVVNGIRKNLILQVTNKQSTVISIKLRGPEPQELDNILNELLIAYNKASINDKNLLASNTLQFINDRLRLVTNELDSVETGIQQFKTKEGIVDLSEQGKQYLANVSINDQQVSQVSVQLAMLDQLEKYIENNNGTGIIAPATFGQDDPELSIILKNLYDLEDEYEKYRKTVGENNPLLSSLQSEIDKVKPIVLQNIRNERASLEAGQQNLNSTSTKYASVLSTLPKKEKQLVEISRQEEIKNNIYTFLLQKREETALNYNSAVADSRLVDNAESSIKPVSPVPILIYLLSVGCVFFIGSLFITLKEMLNQNIRYRTEFENLTNIPVIGEIVNDNSKSNIVIENGKRSYIAEQFRQLRSSLAYLGINGTRKKRILITSTISGEGKSFIAANLAISIALTDKKVVLLEMDLRKPQLSRIFNINADVGLTNYFINNKDAEHIIKKTEINSNLFIIPAGPIPPNPSELIMNGKMLELLQYLDNNFDYILIDSPPVSPVTDAFLISQFVEATIYIVRHNYTPRVHIQRLSEILKIHGVRNVGIVFNGLKKKGIGDKSYGYGYGYGYGYEENKMDRKEKKKQIETNIS